MKETEAKNTFCWLSFSADKKRECSGRKCMAWVDTGADNGYCHFLAPAEKTAMREKTDWIKVADRLPGYEPGLRVLVYTRKHEFMGERFFDILATDLYDPDHGAYRRAFQSLSDRHPGRTYSRHQSNLSEICECVTHWAPLPVVGA